MKIYTKTGDAGQTSLIGGTRVSKADIRIEAYGTIDELNSHIGYLMCYPDLMVQSSVLEHIQHKLFVVGSYLATDKSAIEVSSKSIIHDSDILMLEHEMDKMSAQLPELRAFILPGGSFESSFCHICRTISRRAERKIIEYSDLYEIDIQVVRYINRLSDYFFILSRYVSFLRKEKEILWKNSD
jgi:cob(I)alamin adenosyltransferase